VRPFPGDNLTVLLICMGGLDPVRRSWGSAGSWLLCSAAISVLLSDGPGQGGPPPHTLRRHKIVTRDGISEIIPIGKCIDWLEGRPDVDELRIAVCGSSLEGYTRRARGYEPRLAAAIRMAPIWSVYDLGRKGDDFGLAMHIRWVFGRKR